MVKNWERDIFQGLVRVCTGQYNANDRFFHSVQNITTIDEVNLHCPIIYLSTTRQHQLYCIMVEKDGHPDHVVTPMLFRALTKGKDGNQLLIDLVDKLVIMNSNIAVHGSIVMNHLMLYCISKGFLIPKLTPALVWTAFSYGPGVKYKNDHIHTVSESTAILFQHDPGIDKDGRCISGKGWMIDNLVKTYIANIKSSIQGKLLSVIHNSINVHLDINYPDPPSTKTYVRTY
jgi:hypothetical protein